ncbi:MAG: SAM-dependent methyltransferase, partial [Bifidobacteriaceae bacterium]|nr:SAM-dependent methyltransferase [Bifidobacteriaceae bacterium]
MEISSRLRDFIREHRQENVQQLALHAGITNPQERTWVLEQIAGWQTAAQKIPKIAAYEDIIYPPHISMEQCSSQPSAEYKHYIMNSLLGEQYTFADITGGFGIDFTYLEGSASKAYYVESQKHLCDIVDHNVQVMGMNQAIIMNSTAENFVKNYSDSKLSFVYIDPARRDSHGEKIFAIEDCTPNILDLYQKIFVLTPYVLIKLSPMLDWQKTVKDFQGYVKQIHIVAVGNECKELLVLLDAQHGQEQAVDVYAVNMPAQQAEERNILRLDEGKEHKKFSEDISQFQQYFTYYMHEDYSQQFSSLSNSELQQQQYLYEPNVALLKTGFYQQICQKYNVRQIGLQSHLFVS